MSESTTLWAKRIVELYEQGCSDAEVSADLKMPIRKFYQAIEETPAFKELVEWGRTLSQGWWEGVARKNIWNKSFNSSLYSFYMKNKFGWADKSESINVNESASTDLDTLRNNITKEIARFIKDNTPELTDAKRTVASLMPLDNVNG